MVLVEAAGAVRFLTLNRPERRNAFDRALIDGLSEALDAAFADSGCRVVVVRGAGGHFSGGRDLSGTTPATNLPEYLDRDVAWTGIYKRLGVCDKVTIASVEGFAVAGGMTLAMACDFVVAERGARFGALEMRNGFPAAINTPVMAKLAAPRIGLEMLMTGAFYDAERLYEVGLVNRLADGSEDLGAVTIEFAEQLASLDPDAVAMTKDLHRAASTMPLSNALDMGKYANALLAASGRIGEAEQRYGKKKA